MDFFEVTAIGEVERLEEGGGHFAVIEDIELGFFDAVVFGFEGVGHAFMKVVGELSVFGFVVIGFGAFDFWFVHGVEVDADEYVGFVLVGHFGTGGEVGIGVVGAGHDDIGAFFSELFFDAFGDFEGEVFFEKFS